jgi:hypothetical protein
MAYEKDKMRKLIQGAVQALWDKDEAGPVLADSKLSGLLNALDRKRAPRKGPSGTGSDPSR